MSTKYYEVTELLHYGKSVQNGTPSPDHPIKITSLYDNCDTPVLYHRTTNSDGSITRIKATLPNPLCGVPTPSGGNYTDENGQNWFCDEVDLESSLYVKRTNKYQFTGNETPQMGSSEWQRTGATSCYFICLPSSLFAVSSMNVNATKKCCLSTHCVAGYWAWSECNSLSSVAVNGSIIYLSLPNDATGIIDGDTESEKLAKFKAYLSRLASNGTPLSVQYALTTPIESTLTTETANLSLDYNEQMLNYYPEVIKAIREFQALTKAESIEIENTHIELNRILANAYIADADETRIAQWEKMLGIVPLPQGDDQYDTWLEDRRETILARLYSPQKLNTKTIEEIVSIFTGGETKSYFKNGTIYVLISPPKNNKQYKFENVEQELRKKIPAHLMFQVSRNYYTWLQTKNNHATWGDVKNNFSTWEEVLLSVPV